MFGKDHDDVNYSLLALKGTLSDRGPLVTLGAWVHASKTRANWKCKPVQICKTKIYFFISASLRYSCSLHVTVTPE